MAKLGSDENKKRFLASFNTLQAPPKKKERKQMLKKKRHDYHTSGQAVLGSLFQNERKNFRLSRIHSKQDDLQYL